MTHLRRLLALAVSFAVHVAVLATALGAGTLPAQPPMPPMPPASDAPESIDATRIVDPDTELAITLLDESAPEVVAAGTEEPVEDEPEAEPVAVAPPPPPAPLPEPEPEVAAAPEPAPPEATAAVDAVETHAAEEAPTARAVRGRRPRKDRGTPAQPPCPPARDGITAVTDATWAIERTLVDYYATHIPELMKLGKVYTHRDAAGQPDGFRVRLPRCSLLRQGGLRSGDVVKDINGRRIHNVLQAVGAYLALRNQEVLEVRVERRGKPVVMTYHMEKRRKRKG